MLRVSAAMVAMRSSGQMIVVMILAGTTIPPIPRPARTRIPHRVDMLSGLATDMAPHPAVIRILEITMSDLFAPLNTDRSQSTIHAPAMMLKPTGIPRIPTCPGS